MARSSNCEGSSRRSCLQLGLGAWLGTGLVPALAMRAHAANDVASIEPTAKGCILIWMDGGPTFLGAKYAPFVVADDPNGGHFRVRDVALPKGLTDDKFHHRADLRKLIDTLPRINEKAAGDPVLALDEYYRQGFDLVTSPAA